MPVGALSKREVLCLEARSVCTSFQVTDYRGWKPLPLASDLSARAQVFSEPPNGTRTSAQPPCGPHHSLRVRSNSRISRRTRAGFDELVAAGEGAQVFALALCRGPAVEVEGDNAVGQHPFTVVLAGNVDVRARGAAPLARRVADVVTTLDEGPFGHALAFGNVQVQDVPAGGFAAVTVQVEHDH